MTRALARQLLIFGLVGAAQVVLDWAVFVLLSGAGMPLPPANVIGRVSGACLGFFLNGRYTFADGGSPRLDRQHRWRFLFAWSLLTLLSTLLLAGVASHFDLRMAWRAKPAVEAMMAAIGFVVWRQWVFR